MTPRPWLAEMGKTSGKPSAYASAAAASARLESTLLAATSTGLPDWRSTLATSLSTPVIPSGGVDDEQDQHPPRRGARSVCCRMAPRIPTADGSSPPVSTTRKCRPAPVGDAVAAIARDAGDVLDQRRPAADQAIVERRLADVGTPDQGDQPEALRRSLLVPETGHRLGEVVQSGSMRTVSLMCAGRCRSSLMATRRARPDVAIICPPCRARWPAGFRARPRCWPR